MISPTLSDASLSDEALDAYFATKYVPPSKWPTPPPVTPNMGVKGVEEDFVCGVTGEDLLGPATHLAKLFPATTRFTSPSVPRIAHYLARSGLPIELIAYSACLLDALSSRFSPTWLNVCRDIDRPHITSTTCSKSFLRRTTPKQAVTVPVPVPPELIVLAALSITSSYHQDHSFSKEFWTRIVAQEQFSVQQLNVTISAILVDIHYRLQVFGPERVEEALGDMRRIGRDIAWEKEKKEREKEGGMGLKGRRERPVLRTGMAVWMNGVCTPEPSP